MEPVKEGREKETEKEKKKEKERGEVVMTMMRLEEARGSSCRC